MSCLAAMNKYEIGIGILLGLVPITWPDPPPWAEYVFGFPALFLVVHGLLGEKIKEGLNTAPTRIDIPEIEIIMHEGAPYEVTGESDGKTLSKIRMGIRNFGDSTITDCKVYIDAIDPMPAAIELPIVLHEGLEMPYRYPEVLVDIASQWTHTNQYRFSSEEPSDDLDDETPRTIVVKAEAAQCRRGASFRIWTDKEKRMHIRLISHID